MSHPYFLAPGQPRSAGIPFINVIYKNNSKKTSSTLVLVDSGAQVSFAPLDIALWLGIKVDKKKYLDLRGFNNVDTRCYPAMTTLEIEGHDIVIPIYYGGSTNLQCILGQDPFFDMAKITFERYDNSFSLDWKNFKIRSN